MIAPPLLFLQGGFKNLDDRSASMERVEGYVVDMHCIRQWPQAQWQERARKHLTTCAEEHLESGFCLVDGCAVPLDPAATQMVLRTLREIGDEKGALLRALRKNSDGMMVTTYVDRAIPREPVQSSNIQSVGWQDRTLEIEFKNGLYQFLDVPRQVYEELRDAESHGRYFNSRIRNHFQSRKV